MNDDKNGRGNWLGEEFFAHAPNVLIAEMVPDKKDEAQAQAAATGSEKTAKAGLNVMEPEGSEEFVREVHLIFLSRLFRTYRYICVYSIYRIDD
jgi:hypothetical protein